MELSVSHVCFFGGELDKTPLLVTFYSNSVLAILFHCTESSDEKDGHKFCPRAEVSWCKYQADKITGRKTYKAHNCIPKAVKEVLIKIFKDLISDVLLSKCLHGQNINEFLLTLIWHRCPKEVHTSR